MVVLRFIPNTLNVVEDECDLLEVGRADERRHAGDEDVEAVAIH